MNRDRIELHDLKLDCIIGIHAEERRRPQPLIVHLCAELDTELAGRGADLGLSLDYAALGVAAQFILEAGAFGLLETAAMALCSYLLAPPLATTGVGVEGAAVTLVKPEALAGKGTPSITVHREFRQLQIEEGRTATGLWQCLFHSPDAAVYRVLGNTPLPSSHHLPESCIRQELRLNASTVLQVARPVVDRWA